LIYPASVTSLTLNPTTVTGAGSTTATITLNAPAAAHYVLNVTSTDPTHAAVPSTVTVPQGAKMATFKVTTAAPASGETVTITVSRTNTRSATFTLNP
jgi:hypothetical protein